MNLRCQHIGFNISDVKASKDFYIDKLGLKLIDEKGENFFAAKAGDVRFSFFGGAVKQPTPPDDASGMSIILRTDNINEAKETVLSKGITLIQDIAEAPGFMKWISIEDPDGNIVHIGEYLTNPL